MTTSDNERCVYCTSTNNIIDFIQARESDNDALARLSQYGDSLVVMPADQAFKRIDDAARSDPVEINEDKFLYGSNVLPPVAWVRNHDAESFKISERLCGSITAIYVRLGQRYFTFNDNITMPHNQCCDKAAQSPAFLTPDDPEADDERQ